MKKIIIGILIAIIVFAVWIISQNAFRAHSPESPKLNVASPSIQSERKEFNFAIKNNKLVNIDPVITVHQSDTVVFHISSDVNDEFHLHGYDNSVSLGVGETATLEQIANISGRFSFELENAKIELGALEVLPK